MIIHELFLERAVKAFHVGVHFRRAGVGPPVGDAAGLEASVELPLKLGAVVGEEGAGWGGQEGAEGVQRLGSLAAGP